MAISITKPTVGGSEDTWGDTINTALDTIVDAVNGTSGTTAPNLTEGSWKVGGTAVTASAAELNKLDGVTATTAELNILDGVTATAAELNKLDGVTATTAELNKMDGVTATTAELNVLDGGTAATSTTVAGADRVVLNDNGTMKQVAMTDINTYISGQATAVNDATITISAGGGLSTGGNFTTNAGTNKTITINHSDTSSQASVNNSGNTVIQDVTLDTYGHVTGLTSTTIDASVSTTSGSVAQSSSSQTVSTGVANARVLYWQDGSTSNNAQRIRTTTDSSGNFTASVPYSLTIYWLTWV